MTRQDHMRRVRVNSLTPEANRKRRATMRGVDVPPEREKEWQDLRRKGLTGPERIEAMSLTPLPRPD